MKRAKTLRSLGLGAALSLAAVACGGDEVVLGTGRSQDAGPDAPWGSPRLITALVDPAEDDDPTATADLLELYFNSRREGGAGADDIWVSRRGSTSAAWGTPELVAELCTSERETSPAISLDGLTLYFASNRVDEGRLDVFRATRSSRDAEWSEPELVSELAEWVSESNPDADILPRPPAVGDTRLPLAVRTGGDDAPYDLYLAARPSSTEPWQPPVALETLNEESNEADPWLSGDGSLLWFASGRSGGGDLYTARRAAPSEPFAAPTLVEALASDDEERDPWLSPDGSYLLYASDQDGDFAIYEVTR